MLPTERKKEKQQKNKFRGIESGTGRPQGGEGLGRESSEGSRHQAWSHRGNKNNPHMNDIKYLYLWYNIPTVRTQESDPEAILMCFKPCLVGQIKERKRLKNIKLSQESEMSSSKMDVESDAPFMPIVGEILSRGMPV
jgi:hypothetical protein